jgi:hypothetical protein
MPKNEDLHGNAPDNSPVVLLIIDMISDFEFEDGEKILPFAETMAKNIANPKNVPKKPKSRSFTSTTISANGVVIFANS